MLIILSTYLGTSYLYSQLDITDRLEIGFLRNNTQYIFLILNTETYML